MTKAGVLPQPLDEAAREQAARWMAARRPGAPLEANPDFVTWLERSEANRKAWAAMETVWADFDDATDPLIAALRTQALRARGQRRGWAPAAVAAGLVLAVGAGLAWKQLGEGRPAVLSQPSPVIAATAPPSVVATRIMTTVLPDGTRATLDAGAALAVAYDDHRRAIRLISGRVFLEIAQDPRRPFQLEAGDRRILDRGTAFQAGLDRGQVVVTVASGAVSISGGSNAVTLKPGQRLTTARGHDRVDAVSLDQAMAWRLRQVDFVATPLGEALAEVNRYGGAPARTTDRASATIPISGAFTTGDPTRFAATVAAMHDLKLTYRADGGVDLSTRH